jgi:hypothetical protein
VVGGNVLLPELHGDVAGVLVGDVLLEFLFDVKSAVYAPKGEMTGTRHVVNPTPDSTYQVLEDTLVQLPLGRSALVELLVVVLEAVPVGAERLEAVGVDVLQAAIRSARQFQTHVHHPEPLL